MARIQITIDTDIPAQYIERLVSEVYEKKASSIDSFTKLLKGKWFKIEHVGREYKDQNYHGWGPISYELKIVAG